MIVKLYTLTWNHIFPQKFRCRNTPPQRNAVEECDLMLSSAEIVSDELFMVCISTTLPSTGNDTGLAIWNMLKLFHSATSCVGCVGKV